MLRVVLLAGLVLSLAVTAEAKPAWRPQAPGLPPGVHVVSFGPARAGPVWRHWRPRVAPVATAPAPPPKPVVVMAPPPEPVVVAPPPPPKPVEVAATEPAPPAAKAPAPPPPAPAVPVAAPQANPSQPGQFILGLVLAAAVGAAIYFFGWRRKGAIGA